MNLRRALAGLVFGASLAGSQQRPVVVIDQGPGPAGRHLASLLADPATRIVRGDTVVLPVDSSFGGSVVVLAERAYLRGSVRGDLVVVGGELFIKPGARVTGRAVAIGGAVYPSLLAAVGSVESHRDVTYDSIDAPDGTEFRYRELVDMSPESFLTFPGMFGLRLPTYDRSDGVSLPVGPTLSAGPLTVDALVTYRSQTGAFDPSVEGRFQPGRRHWLIAYAGRETRTNDRWITGDIPNSIVTLITGTDTRNWYRADAASLLGYRLAERPSVVATYRLGGQLERASSARPNGVPTSHPWSMLGGGSTEKMLRPNPQIPGGTIASAIGGAEYLWGATDLRANLDIQVEAGFGDDEFIQTTVDGQIRFPTFGTQRFRFESHAILTTGGQAPPQRYGYVGGSGTLPTEDMLVFGGDQLVYFESRYEIPLDSLMLPLVGSPTITLRHMMGSAGAGTLPRLTQQLGIRLSVPFVRIQLHYDPVSGRTKFSGGLSLTR